MYCSSHSSMCGYANCVLDIACVLLAHLTCAGCFASVWILIRLLAGSVAVLACAFLCTDAYVCILGSVLLWPHVCVRRLM
jgi:hypothetical protein